PLLLIGPNGAGKTTLLRALAGALNPESGNIRIGNRTLFDSARGVSLPPEERRISYVPQGFGIFEHLSVLDNVAFALSVGAARIPRHRRRAQAAQILEDLGSARLKNLRAAELSG